MNLSVCWTIDCKMYPELCPWVPVDPLIQVTAGGLIPVLGSIKVFSIQDFG